MANIKPTERMTSAQRKFGTSGVLYDGFEVNNFNIPKAGYNFVVKFELSVAAKDIILEMYGVDVPLNLYAAFQVKEADRPSFSMQIDTMNQYNKTRQSPGKITYDPVNITFYDTVDSMGLKLLDAYKYYYYGDFSQKGLGSFSYDTISSPKAFEAFSGDNHTWGRSTLKQGNENQGYFFKRIDLFEIDGSQFTAYNIHHPVIEAVDMGKKDMASEGEPQTFGITFKHEGITNINPITGQKALGAASNELSAMLLNTSEYGQLGQYKMWGEMDDPNAPNIDPNLTKVIQPSQQEDFTFTSILEKGFEFAGSIDGLIGGFSDIWESSDGIVDTATNLYNSVATGDIGDSISSAGSSVSGIVKGIGGLF